MRCDRLYQSTVRLRYAPGLDGDCIVKFSELVRRLEQNGFALVREKGSIRYYAKAGVPRVIRVDFHGAKEVPTGTCNAMLKAAGLRSPKEDGT